MTALAFANASAHAAVDAAARAIRRIQSAFARYAAIIAEARIDRARLEAEAYLDRYRMRSKMDDNIPFLF